MNCKSNPLLSNRKTDHFNKQIIRKKTNKINHRCHSNNPINHIVFQDLSLCDIHSYQTSVSYQDPSI